jgi:Flp pilus assembly pilin Flp
MKLLKTIGSISKKIAKKVKEFIKDDYAGNLVEYALLVGFALFVFFLLVSVITSMLDWTLGQSNEFFEVIEGLSG